MKIVEHQAKISPNNIQAEQMVLGAILINNQALSSVSEFLSKEHFFEILHSKIYASILQVVQKGITATPISLKNMLHDNIAFNEIGGIDYLNKLTTLALTVINVREYGQIVHDLAIRRNLITIGEKIVNTAYKSTITDSTISQIEAAELDLFNLVVKGESSRGFISLNTAIDESWNMIALAIKNQNPMNGITSGFTEIDNKLAGFKNSDLVILAARPSMGKTALVLNLAVNSCREMYKKYCNENKIDPQDYYPRSDHTPPAVGVFSLEMSTNQIVHRILSMEAKVEAMKLSSGNLSEQEINILKNVNEEIKKWPFFIDDTPSLSIAAIRSRARRLKRNHNLGILFIDYLQLIRVEGGHLSRVHEISEITQNLKALAKELDIPVIALSQLSRAVEQRPDKRPLLSDLRESGSIEQDADIVMFIYREEYYLTRCEPPNNTDEHLEWMKKLDEVHNKADIIIAKHRNGPVGAVSLKYETFYSKFSNYTSAKDAIGNRVNLMNQDS